MQPIKTQHTNLRDGNALPGVDLQARGSALDKGLQSLAATDSVDAAIISACRELQNDLLPWVQNKLDELPLDAQQVAWKGWDWHSFLSNTHLRIGLIVLHAGEAIPIHDHPGSSGLLLVVQGRVQLQQYRMCDAMSHAGHQALAELQPQDRQQLKLHQYTHFTPSADNIHSLHAEEEPCVLLDILCSPFNEGQRTWYLALDGQNKDTQSFPAMCLHGHARRNHTNRANNTK